MPIMEKSPREAHRDIKVAPFTPPDSEDDKNKDSNSSLDHGVQFQSPFLIQTAFPIE